MLDCWHLLKFVFPLHLLCGLRLEPTLCYNDTIRVHAIYTNTVSELAAAIWQVTGLHNWLKQETECAVSVCACACVRHRECVRRQPFLYVATTLSIIMQQMSLLSLLWSLDISAAAREHPPLRDTHAQDTH